jgi:N6-L-threonylcarbamoyladenine synthase
MSESLVANQASVTILAIESSCDDTSAAVIKDGVMLSNFIATQTIHEQYGGVIPELASRAHQSNIVPVVEAALQKAGVSKHDLNAIAFTRGPGLMGSLLVGVSFAKGMALSLDIPMIEVNHMIGHILAHFIDEPKPAFPFLCLTVSGGHTQIVLVKSPLDMEVIGETIDDAAGEAFDKTGKMLGLPYPAGPVIDRLAKLGEARFAFSEPKIDGLNFSFSGLKTQIMHFIARETKANPDFLTENINDICASVQSRIISILLNKLKTAAKLHNIKHLAIAGGVSANSGLRDAFHELGKRHGWQTYIPQFQYCTDNAGMIAMTAHYKYLANAFVGHDIAPTPRMPIGV